MTISKSRLRRNAVVAGATFAVVLGAAAPGTAGPADGSASWCGSGDLDARLTPEVFRLADCDFRGRVVRVDGIRVVVPPSGVTVTGSAVAPAGAPDAASQLSVGRNGDELSVHYVDDTTPASSAASADVDSDLYQTPLASDDDAPADVLDPSLVEATDTASPSECTDAAYAIAAERWYSSPTYYVNNAGKPANLTADSVNDHVKAAQVNMTRGDNRCGFTSDPRGGASLGGTTTATANISSSNTCLTPDTRSVVSWGALPTTALATACT